MLRGQNTTSDQNSYDLIFKDIIINYTADIEALKRSFTVDLSFEINKMYKAELISGIVHFSGIHLPINVKNSALFVNIPQINGNTIVCNTASKMFCQISDNATPLGNHSNTLSTFVNNSNYSCFQFYNPTINNIFKLDVSVSDIYGNNLLVENETECGTTHIESLYLVIRVYYFIKRNPATSFSTQAFNNQESASNFSPF